MLNKKIPSVIFKTRMKDAKADGNNSFCWKEITTEDLFADKKVILFSLPGAFTPICSTFQLPNYEKLAPEFKAKGIDRIYCISVNDAFVMNKWGDSQSLNNIILIPDGSGFFTKQMGMLVDKDNLGFGKRSWRYAAIINNLIIEQWFEEPGFENNCEDDPYSVSSPEHVLKSLS